MTHANFARQLAERMHAGQRDAHGAPYIYHIYRVVSELGAGHADDLLLAAGFLHDIIEDTKITGQTLLDLGFPVEVVDTVEAVTKLQYLNLPTPDERYAAYIDDVIRSGNKDALLIKRADLRDHLYGSKPAPARLLRRYMDALPRVEAALERMQS